MSTSDRAIPILSLIIFGMLFVDPAVARLTRQLDPEARSFFRLITDIGKSGWILALTGAAVVACLAFSVRAAHLRCRVGRCYAGQVAVFVFLSVAGTGLAADVLKLLVGRARPKLIETVGAIDFSPLAFNADFASFPSGHSTTAFALATSLTLLFPRLAIPLFTAAGWIAVSRVATSAHYVADVMAGAALGSFGTLLVRDEFAARGIVFKASGEGCSLRGRRLGCWMGRTIGLSARTIAARPLDAALSQMARGETESPEAHPLDLAFAHDNHR